MSAHRTSFLTALFLLALGGGPSLHAATTHREKQFENKDVTVWKTTITPHHPLKMHRHDHPRVVVALTDVTLTVMNDQHKTHSILLKKGQSTFLKADQLGELHGDTNTSKYPEEVIVIEVKK